MGKIIILVTFITIFLLSWLLINLQTSNKNLKNEVLSMLNLKFGENIPIFQKKNPLDGCADVYLGKGSI